MQLMQGIPYVGKHIIVTYLGLPIPAIITAVNGDGSWIGMIEWAYA